MPHPIFATKEDVKRIEKLLKTEKTVKCLDEVAYIKTLLVGQRMLMQGKTLQAKIEKGF